MWALTSPGCSTSWIYLSTATLSLLRESAPITTILLKKSQPRRHNKVDAHGGEGVLRYAERERAAPVHPHLGVPGQGRQLAGPDRPSAEGRGRPWYLNNLHRRAYEGYRLHSEYRLYSGQVRVQGASLTSGGEYLRAAVHRRRVARDPDLRAVLRRVPLHHVQVGSQRQHGRCVTLLLFVALTILYAAYSANIVVLLRAPSSSVNTLPDLLNSPLKLGASDFEYNRYFFRKVNDPIRKAIYDKKIAPKGKKPNFYSMKEGIEKIRKGLFAFHMEVNPGYRLIQETFLEEEKCDLTEINYLNEIDPWLPAKKRSPYKDLFKISLIKIRETGVQACIFHRLQVSKPRCSGSISTFSSVGITDMYPALVASLYGVLISIAVLILEISYKRLLLLREKRKVTKSLQY